MGQCPKCEKTLADGVKFCDNCGTQIFETIFCPNCGKQTSSEFAFCQSCGASLSDDAIVKSQQKKKFSLPKLSLKISKKVMALASAALALILVVAILLSILFSAGNKNNFAIYIKDGEMYYTGLLKIDPMQVTSRLISYDFDEDENENEELSQMSYSLGMYTQLSSDGKILFYVDKIDDEEGVTLYFRYINKPDDEPTKIDAHISTYSISEDGKYVTYLKGYDDESDLYQYNLKEKDKIDSEVKEFNVSDDGKKIIYLNDEGNIYFKAKGKDKEKIDRDVSFISYVNEDYNTVYYKKDDSLYKKVIGKDKVKIASDVSSVIQVYESGEIYYLKSDSDEVTLMDYVEDDYKDIDETMIEPEYPDSPSYWDYDSFYEYEEAYEKYEEEYDAYIDALDTYYAKEDRDELREELSDETMEQSIYTLFYYNGKKEIELADTVDYSNTYAIDNPVLIYSVYNQSSVEKVKLSEIDSVSDVKDMVEEAMFSSTEAYVAIKDNTTAIKQKDADEFNITSDGKTVYFLSDVSEKNNHGDLYKMNISGGKAQKPKLYDTDVYASWTYILRDDMYLYYKDVEDGEGELYINKEKIDDDVVLYGIGLSIDDKIAYMVDWNSDKSYGTLKIYDHGKTKKIADDVSTFDFTPNGDVLYLYDYSNTRYKGELYIYKNGKSKKIDDDVIAIVPIYYSKYRGDYYYGW